MTEYPKDASGSTAIQHPEHGTLLVTDRRQGRSIICLKGDDTEVVVGTRTVNRLLGLRPKTSAASRTMPLPIPLPEVAEQLPDAVTRLLGAMDDGPVRTRIARDIWAAADRFLAT